MSNCKLILLSSQFKGLTYELSEDQYACGRLPDKDISIPDTTVSSYHCDFIKSGNSYILRDRHSTNGTRVNNQPITEQLLNHTDLVTIGMVEALFEADDGTVSVSKPSDVKLNILDHATTKTVVCVQPTALGAKPARSTGVANNKLVIAVVSILILVILALIVFLSYLLFFSK